MLTFCLLSGCSVPESTQALRERLAAIQAKAQRGEPVADEIGELIAGANSTTGAAFSADRNTVRETLRGFRLLVWELAVLVGGVVRRLIGGA